MLALHLTDKLDDLPLVVLLVCTLWCLGLLHPVSCEEAPEGTQNTEQAKLQ